MYALDIHTSIHASILFVKNICVRLKQILPMLHKIKLLNYGLHVFTKLTYPMQHRKIFLLHNWLNFLRLTYSMCDSQRTHITFTGFYNWNTTELIFSMPRLSNPVCEAFRAYCCSDSLALRGIKSNENGKGDFQELFHFKVIQFKAENIHLQQADKELLDKRRKQMP